MIDVILSWVSFLARIAALVAAAVAVTHGHHAEATYYIAVAIYLAVTEVRARRDP